MHEGDEVEEFWALKDVSFEVRRGEVVGIIGRNGAGKSTLLKILSRVTEPTCGRVTMNGRVASLLEVGTGFHPELTGQENIFLNGAILGMSQREIRKKFDEIVAFAEIERFLDTPVKRYSSGMYVRLAFSVAAHLEPEILVIDEVLAVGDLAFQKRCLGKMREATSKEGRTVLFVSHNMAAVEGLCDRAVHLRAGRCISQGHPRDILREYSYQVSAIVDASLQERADRQGSGELRFVSLSLEGADGSCVPLFRCGEKAVLSYVVENTTRKALRNVRVATSIDDQFGRHITSLDSNVLNENIRVLEPGRTRVQITIPKMPLCPGRYNLTLWSSANETVADWIKDAASFDVEGGDYFGTGRLPESRSPILLFDHHFSNSSVTQQS